MSRTCKDGLFRGCLRLKRAPNAVAHGGAGALPGPSYQGPQSPALLPLIPREGIQPEHPVCSHELPPILGLARATPEEHAAATSPRRWRRPLLSQVLEVLDVNSSKFSLSWQVAFSVPHPLLWASCEILFATALYLSDVLCLRFVMVWAVPAGTDSSGAVVIASLAQRLFAGTSVDV